MNVIPIRRRKTSPKTYPMADPGPMTRLEALKADPDAPHDVFRMLVDRKTLPQIAKEWKLPKTRFVYWFVERHADLYHRAIYAVIADLGLEAARSAREATPDTVTVNALQAKVALKLAAMFDRQRVPKCVRASTYQPSSDADLI